MAISAKLHAVVEERLMQTLSAKEAKYGFGKLIDLARVAPTAVAKHGRPVVVVMAIEEFERLKAYDPTANQLHPSSRKTRTTQ
jgi:prevent-host-death family protein